MGENIPTTVELKQPQLDYLQAMTEKHNLPDISKAVRCLITYAMEESGQESVIFDEIRCTNC